MESNNHNCDCNCGCQNPRVYTPSRIYNSAGQPSLSYRIGTHAQFKSDMLLAALSEKSLRNLKTKEDSDLSVAMIDSWALVADVLTFYQERIANEGFLRTSTERRSLLELARSIGYELKPGVAAGTHLAFSMDAAAGSPKKAKIAIGTKVQSVPGQGELPQIFETIEEIEAHQPWNEIKPQLTEKQDLKTALSKGKVVLAGTSTKLKAGDCLLFAIGGTKAAFVVAKQVDVDAKNQLTYVLFDGKKTLTSDSPNISESGEKQQSDLVVDSKSKLNRSDIYKLIKSPWTEQDLQSKATVEGWSMDDIVDAVNSERERQKEDTDGDAVYAFRVKCGIFGNAAPKWDSLPPEQRYEYTSDKKFKEGSTIKTTIGAPYGKDWDSGNGFPVNKSSSDAFYDEKDKNLFYLDNTYQNIQPASWIVLTGPSKTSGFHVSKVTEASLTGFAMTAKVTGLTVGVDASSDWIKFNSTAPSVVDDLSAFYFRTTTVYAAPEKLELAQVAIEAAVGSNNVMLDSMVGWLWPERPIAISGELEGQPGIYKKEIAVISSIVHFEGGNLLTKLNLLKPLEHVYKRDTVKINANVAKATHGETKQVSIGSGDPTQRFQEFPLKQSPLTFVSSGTPSGVSSTLEVTVDGVRWKEVESFEGLGYRDPAYITQRGDDAVTTVITGDGNTGRLPPAGRENVKAKYRVGIGSAGLLSADQLSILMTRPLGVRGVTNPLKTSGAEDPESLDDARKNAPRTVLTMDRIVSLEDYKSFAQGFAGIGKATSYMVRIGGVDMVLVAVSGQSGEEIDTDLHDNLVKAIESYKDPAAQFTLRSFKPRAFNVEAKILVSDDREFKDVEAAVGVALKGAFSFDNRDFGQAVTISEVTSVIQSVEGVEAVDIEFLYEHGSATKTRDDIIRAAGVEDGSNHVTIPSLLLINKDKIAIAEMQSK